MIQLRAPHPHKQAHQVPWCVTPEHVPVKLRQLLHCSNSGTTTILQQEHLKKIINSKGRKVRNPKYDCLALNRRWLSPVGACLHRGKQIPSYLLQDVMHKQEEVRNTHTCRLAAVICMLLHNNYCPLWDSDQGCHRPWCAFPEPAVNNAVQGVRKVPDTLRQVPGSAGESPNHTV